MVGEKTDAVTVVKEIERKINMLDSVDVSAFPGYGNTLIGIKHIQVE